MLDGGFLQFDKENKPIGYVAAGTPGEPSVNREMGPPGMITKLNIGLRHGYDVLELDLWKKGEIFEPRLKDKVQQIYAANPTLTVGIHFSLQIDLTLAVNPEWQYSHDYMTLFTLASKEIFKAKFINIHSNQNPTPEFSEQKSRPQHVKRGYLVDFDGRNLGAFIDEYSPGGKSWKSGDFNLRGWFLVMFPKEIFHAMGAVPSVEIVQTFDKYVKECRDKRVAPDYYQLIGGILADRKKVTKVLREIGVFIEDAGKLSGDALKNHLNKEGISLENYNLMRSLLARETGLEEIDQIRKLFAQGHRWHLTADIFKNLETFVNISHYVGGDGLRWEDSFKYMKNYGFEGSEEIAYRVVAKWLFTKRDNLWNLIVGGFENKHDPDVIIKKFIDIKDSGETGQKFTEAKAEVFKVIAAVAARYVEGHLEKPMKVEEEIDVKNKELAEFKKAMFIPQTEQYKSIYNYCRDYGMHIYIETPNAIEGAEGEMRLMHAKDHIAIIKVMHTRTDDKKKLKFPGENISYNMDFEHLVGQELNPMRQINDLKEGDGRFITMVHTNPPKAVEPSHAILRKMSRDMEIIYIWYWELRKKGMKNAYFVWEMGGDKGVEESAVSFRLIIKELSNDIPPDKMPPEMFGLDKNFEAEQRVNIMHHMNDPLEGLFIIPESEWTELSAAAQRRGKGELWRRDQYR